MTRLSSSFSRRRGLFAGSVLVCLFGTACGGSAPRSAQQGRRELRPTRGFIIVDFDALRADHLGAYGYPLPTSPFLDRLARQSALFEWAFAPYPSTLVSNMSVMTGLYPPQHGVYPPKGVLSNQIETLAERFARHGFHTAGHTEGGFMSGSYGFSRGFAEWSDTPQKHDTDIERTFSRGVGFLEGLRSDERFLLLLHTFTPHDPYDPPEPFRSQFLTRKLPEGPPPTGRTLVDFNAGRVSLSPERIAAFKSLYDASIRYGDHVLEGFFGKLDELGLRDETTIVVVSDHGEEFDEHGKLAHTQVYPECLRIPLVISHPDLKEGVVVRGPVSNVSIAPTLYELAGIPVPEGLAGRSLVPQLRGEAVAPGDLYAEVRLDVTVRSLIRAKGGALDQLLSQAPEPDAEGTWVIRSITFDATPPLVLELRAYHEPRRVTVRHPDGQEEQLSLQPSWSRFEIPSNGNAVQRLTLTADGCVSPAEIGGGDDSRCLSFQIRRPSPHRLELYDLHRDSLARADLSHEQTALLRSLQERLLALHFAPVAPPSSQVLSPEVEETLRSLGYIE